MARLAMLVFLLMFVWAIAAAQWVDYNQETSLLDVSYDAAEGASYYVISINEGEFQADRRIGMTTNTSASGVPITSGVSAVTVRVYAYAANGSLIGTTHDGTWGGEWEPPPFQTEGYYGDYRVFANTHFGADKDALYYEHFGEDLFFLHNATYIDDWQYDEDSFWLHESVNSAAIAFSTSLPVYAWVEYGLTTSYGASTDTTYARYFVHLRHIKGLDPDTQYYYRIRARDVRDNQISETGTFTTTNMNGKIAVPGSMSGPPYRIQAGGEYFLADDIDANSGAIYLEAEYITLDLNGHTITYDNVFNSDYDNADDTTYRNNSDFNAPAGVRTAGDVSSMGRNATILNGIITQGPGETRGSTSQPHGPNPVFIRRSGGTVKGIKAEWYAHHTGGIVPTSSNLTVMYCDLADKGHGIGNRMSPTVAIGNYGESFSIHSSYNLIRRARQMGIAEPGGQSGGIGNEVHVDTWCTNSAAISPFTNARIINNKIFGTGYHGVGLYWARYDHTDSLVYRNNFVHLQGDEPNNRDDEYGEHSSVVGFRITQYGGSQREYNNYLLEGNTFLVLGKNSTDIVRGVQLTTDQYVDNFIFRNNTIKHGFIDASSPGGTAAAVVFNRLGNDTPMTMNIYSNTISSNICAFMINEGYGDASGVLGIENFWVYDNNIARYGDRGDWATIRAGYWSCADFSNRFIDNTFTGGASVDDVTWNGTGTRWYWAGISLYVEARNGSDDSLIASTELTVTSTATGHSASNFSDGFDADASGLARLHLIETTYIPTGSAAHTGHTITIPGFAPALVDTIAGFDWNALPNTGTPLTVYFTPEP